MTAETVSAPAETTVPGTFHTTHSALLEALKVTGVAILGHPVLPALAGVLFTFDGAGSATLQTSDFETAVTYSLPAVHHTGGPIRVLLTHRELAKLLPALTKGVAKRTAADLPVVIEQNGAEASLILNGYTMPLEVLPVDDYPDLPPRAPMVGTFEVPELVENVARAAAAIGHDETVPVLNGINLRWQDGELRLCCTDRYRLTVATQRVDDRTEYGFTGTAPGELVKLVSYLPADQIGYLGYDREAGRLSVWAGSATFTLRLLDGQFPQVDSLIPSVEQIGVTYVYDRAWLLLAAERAAAVLQAKSMRTTWVTLDLAADSVSVRPVLDDGQVQAPSMPAISIIRTEARRITVSCNVRILVDLLKNFSTDKVAMHVQDVKTVKPVLFTAESDGVTDPTAYRHMIMPVRIPSNGDV